MAKSIITVKTEAVIHGITRPNEGDTLLFCPFLNNGNMIAEYVDEEQNKRFASGILCLLFNGITVRPYQLQYRSIWGVSTVPFELTEGIITKTPQTHHSGTSVLFSTGSEAITNQLKGKALIVERVYNGTFNKRKEGTFNWDLIGLGITDDPCKVKGDVLTIGKLTASVKDLQAQFDAMEKAQNERLAQL